MNKKIKQIKGLDPNKQYTITPANNTAESVLYLTELAPPLVSIQYVKPAVPPSTTDTVYTFTPVNGVVTLPTMRVNGVDLGVDTNPNNQKQYWLFGDLISTVGFMNGTSFVACDRNLGRPVIPRLRYGSYLTGYYVPYNAADNTWDMPDIQYSGSTLVPANDHYVMPLVCSNLYSSSRNANEDWGNVGYEADVNQVRVDIPVRFLPHANAGTSGSVFGGGPIYISHNGHGCGWLGSCVYNTILTEDANDTHITFSTFQNANTGWHYLVSNGYFHELGTNNDRPCRIVYLMVNRTESSVSSSYNTSFPMELHFLPDESTFVKRSIFGTIKHMLLKVWRESRYTDQFIEGKGYTYEIPKETWQRSETARQKKQGFVR